MRWKILRRGFSVSGLDGKRWREVEGTGKQRLVVSGVDGREMEGRWRVTGECGGVMECSGLEGWREVESKWKEGLVDGWEGLKDVENKWNNCGEDGVWCMLVE